MSERLAYLKDNGDGTWNAIIVGNIADKKGDVLDALLAKPKDEIDAYVEKWLGTRRRIL